MKTCVWCMGQLHDQAIVCPGCGRPFLGGAREVIQFNAAYVVAHTLDGGYGIWSTVSGGAAPIEAWDGNKEGWLAAASKYNEVTHRATSGGGMGFLAGVILPVEI